MAKMQMVRIYTAEGDLNINKIIKYLRDEMHIRGATVFRAVTGYGTSGEIHSANILYMSLDLPLILEFFDEKTKCIKVIDYLKTFMEPAHMLTWEIDVI